MHDTFYLQKILMLLIGPLYRHLLRKTFLLLPCGSLSVQESGGDGERLSSVVRGVGLENALDDG